MSRGYSLKLELQIAQHLSEGAKSPKQIADLTGLNSSTVRSALAAMAKQGRITRTEVGSYEINVESEDPLIVPSRLTDRMGIASQPVIIPLVTPLEDKDLPTVTLRDILVATVVFTVMLVAISILVLVWYFATR